MNDKFWGLDWVSKWSRNDRQRRGRGLLFSPALLLVRRVPLTELNIKIPLSEMRSFNALSVAPTAWSLLLTRKITLRLKIKLPYLGSDQLSGQVEMVCRGKAPGNVFFFSRHLHAMFLGEVPKSVSDKCSCCYCCLCSVRGGKYSFRAPERTTVPLTGQRWGQCTKEQSDVKV